MFRKGLETRFAELCGQRPSKRRLNGQREGSRSRCAGPSAYFAGMAVRAAQQWKFSPANVDGQNFPDEWLLRFEFSAIDTKAVAVRSGTPPRPQVNQ